MATHGSQFDDCEHRRAYERALAYALTQAVTSANASQPVKIVSEYQNASRVHDWSDERAYFCPSSECVCHATRATA